MYMHVQACRPTLLQRLQGSLAHEVHLACCLVELHILQHSPKANGLVDLWLTGSLQADALGVAAALDVEHTCGGKRQTTRQAAQLSWTLRLDRGSSHPQY